MVDTLSQSADRGVNTQNYAKLKYLLWQVLREIRLIFISCQKFVCYLSVTQLDTRHTSAVSNTCCFMKVHVEIAAL